MVNTAYENLMIGARMARKLAEEYRIEAQETTCEERRERCIQQAKEADERADWYTYHASVIDLVSGRNAA